jgi:hypothetical protein
LRSISTKYDPGTAAIEDGRVREKGERRGRGASPDPSAAIRGAWCAVLPFRHQVLEPAEWQPPHVWFTGSQLETVTSTVPFLCVAVFTVWAVKL